MSKKGFVQVIFHALGGGKYVTYENSPENPDRYLPLRGKGGQNAVEAIDDLNKRHGPGNWGEMKTDVATPPTGDDTSGYNDSML